MIRRTHIVSQEHCGRRLNFVTWYLPQRRALQSLSIFIASWSIKLFIVYCQVAVHCVQHHFVCMHSLVRTPKTMVIGLGARFVHTRNRALIVQFLPMVVEKAYRYHVYKALHHSYTTENTLVSWDGHFLHSVGTVFCTVQLSCDQKLRNPFHKQFKIWYREWLALHWILRSWLVHVWNHH